MQQNERGFAASPKDAATPEEKQRGRFCSFPHRHGDARTKFCSFPHRHGDARGEAETEVWNSPIDMATCAQQNERGFAAFPIDTELTTRKRRKKRREKRCDDQLAANKGPAPRPPDYKREPFATQSGNVTGWSGENRANVLCIC